MHISLNTAEEISGLDKQVLSVLAGGTVAPAAAPAKAAPAKTQGKAPAKPTPEPETAVEPEPEADEAPAGATLEEAVALATKMVSNGEAAKVKKALGTVGAKKVSEVSADKVDEFISALS